MAIKNISSNPVEVKYGGNDRILQPNGELDVRDLGVLNDQVVFVEQHIIQKAEKRGEKIVQVASKDVKLSDENVNLKQQLDVAKQKIENLEGELKSACDDLALAVKDNDRMRGELDKALKLVVEYKDQAKGKKEKG